MTTLHRHKYLTRTIMYISGHPWLFNPAVTTNQPGSASVHGSMNNEAGSSQAADIGRKRLKISDLFSKVGHSVDMRF